MNKIQLKVFLTYCNIVGLNNTPLDKAVEEFNIEFSAYNFDIKLIKALIACSKYKLEFEVSEAYRYTKDLYSALEEWDLI